MLRSGFHLLENVCSSPSWFLKGVYHYWKSGLFVPGDLSKWWVGVPLGFLKSVAWCFVPRGFAFTSRTRVQNPPTQGRPRFS